MSYFSPATNMSAGEKVEVLSDIEHVMQRPAQYVGSTTTSYITDWVWCNDTKKMVLREKIKHNEGLIKVLFEVIDNAADNASRKSDPTTIIDVTLVDGVFTVRNNGAGISTEKLEANGLYVPTTVFGVPRSGTKFNEDREGTIGMNGLGVKLTNILSKSFSITCNDKENGVVFTQQWRNNMRERGKEKIKKKANLDKAKYSTIVSVVPDLDYFNRGENECTIDSLDELAAIVHTRLLQVSVSHPKAVKIYFNGHAIKCKGIKAYMKLFTDEKTFFDSTNDNFEYGVTIAPDGVFSHQSFVNCQRTTSDNSTHTKYVKNAITNAISSHLKKKGMSVRLSNAAISSNLFVFVNIRMKNPGFTTQTKVELTTIIDPKKFPIDVKRVMGLVKSSGLLSNMEEQLSKKALTTMQSTLNGTKSRSVNIPKLDDAEEAGRARSAKTTLFLVEGDSAKTMVTTGMEVIGRDYYGVFPLKGKLLNVMGASLKQLKENTEICNVMKIMGLNFNKTYETDAERRTLRYGKVCTLCDADHDGVHITGLLLTFFNHYWPALVRDGFLTRFITPIIRASKGKVVKRFFTMTDYEKFVSETPTMSGWEVQHLKGLGTSKKEDTLIYFKNMAMQHLKEFSGDDETSDLIKHIFDPKESAWRKDWLLAPMNEDRLNYNDKKMNISKFLKTEMHDFSMYNIKRAVPSAIDGLKVSQRKVIHTCFIKFKSPETPEFKVAQLAAMVAAKTNYAHGEVSLQNTITNMAQSFAASNNMPLLTEGGAFGSRRMNGSDASSARYIFTRLRDDARNLFRDRSENVLEYLTEENMKVEPAFYVPTLPLVLINGTNGIATGFRSLVPSFNPADVIYNIRCKFHADVVTPKALVPWYGDTYKTNHKTKVSGTNWVFEGEVEYNPVTKTVVITEVPIGVSFEDYKTKVLDPMEAKGLFKSTSIKHVTSNDPKFVISGYEGSSDTEDLIETFKLRKTMTMNCMNLLDEHGIIKNFSTPEEILEYWYTQRRKCVAASHKEGIKVMKQVISDLDVKYKFIKAIVDGLVKVNKRKADDIVNDMVAASVSDDRGHIKNLLNTMSLSSLTVEKYTDLKATHDKKVEELVEYSKRTVDDFIDSDLTLFPMANDSRKRGMSSETHVKSKKIKI